jgi:hypothetical protein
VSVYTITYEQRVDDYGVVTLLVNAPLSVGQSITLAGLGHGLDGTHVVYALPQNLVVGVDEYGRVEEGPITVPNQVVFFDSGPDVSRRPVSGATLTVAAASWITSIDVEDYLGLDTLAVRDAQFMEWCTDAANQFAYRRRQEAGYVDSTSTVPTDAVFLGTVMVAAAYFRQRSSYSTIASFEQLGAPPASSVTPMIMQLLGINRPQVA